MATVQWTPVHGEALRLVRRVARERQIDAARAIGIPYWRFTRIERAYAQPTESERAMIFGRYPMLTRAFADFEERGQVER